MYGKSLTKNLEYLLLPNNFSSCDSFGDIFNILHKSLWEKWSNKMQSGCNYSTTAKFNLNAENDAF